MPIRIIPRFDEVRTIQDAWDKIVHIHSSDILRLDVTSTFEWAESLWQSHLKEKNQPTLVLEKQEGIVGILPLYFSNSYIHAIPCRRISPITELYSGRCGFLLKDSCVDDLDALLRYLHSDLSGWDVFAFTLVDGAPSTQMLLEVTKQQGYLIEKVTTQTSPYIVLRGTWEEYFSSLPKKFRWSLRDSEKRMKAVGILSYTEYRENSDLDRFLDAVFHIEQNSWKEKTKTSITFNDDQRRLYTNLISKVASRGWLSGHLLELNGEPIAYIYGLLFNGIFYDLKESYHIAYQSNSPGHVLKLFAIERLYERGACLYDYMGVCEPYKMRWTDKTYIRTGYLMYNGTLNGRVAEMSGKLMRYGRSCVKLFGNVGEVVEKRKRRHHPGK